MRVLVATVSLLPLSLACNALLGIGDLPAPSDAGAAEAGDAVGLADGGADGFCAQGATFCADFDESEDAEELEVPFALTLRERDGRGSCSGTVRPVK